MWIQLKECRVCRVCRVFYNFLKIGMIKLNFVFKEIKTDPTPYIHTLHPTQTYYFIYLNTKQWDKIKEVPKGRIKGKNNVASLKKKIAQIWRMTVTQFQSMYLLKVLIFKWLAIYLRLNQIRRRTLMINYSEKIKRKKDWEHKKDIMEQ